MTDTKTAELVSVVDALQGYLGIAWARGGPAAAKTISDAIAHIQGLEAEKAELEAELKLKSELYERSYNDLLGRNDESTTANARLRKALGFYANPDSWKTQGHPQMDADCNPITRDGGDVARQALTPNPDTGATTEEKS